MILNAVITMYKPARVKTVTETTKGNQLTASSKLQSTVGNIWHNASFEHTLTSWSPNNAALSRSTTAERAYHGNYSVKAVNTATSNGALLGPGVSVSPGRSITFSAYLYTPDGQCRLGLHDYVNGAEHCFSQILSQTNTWSRLEVSYTNETEVNQYFNITLFVLGSGTVYMDCAQVERSAAASRYNLVDNGDFSNGFYGWMDNSGSIVTLDESAASMLEKSAHKMVGSPVSRKRLRQTVYVKGNADDVFVVSGWAKGDSVPLEEVGEYNREFAIRATFNYTDGSASDSFLARFNPDTNSEENWQYSAAAGVAKHPYSSVTVELLYDYNANTVYFDGIQLYKEEFSNSYTYDSNGNVTAVKDLQGQTTKYEYTSNNLTKEILPTGAKLTYTYDNYHNVKTATTQTGIVYNFAYDAYGNNTSVSIVNGSNKITSTATYSEDGNRLVSTTDALGNVTTYGYDADTNVLEWVQYPEDTEATRTNYTYDSMYRLATATATTDTNTALRASYTYDNDLLTKIETGSTTYSFSYGNFALRSAIQIGSRTLASYSYTTDRNNWLSSLDYGNEDKVQYAYDKQGRVTKQTYEDGATVTYKYDNNGALATVTDSETGVTTTYYYDFTDRLMKYVESGSNYNHSVGYGYDNINNLTSLVETINGVSHTTSYAYDADNRLTTVTNGDASKTYTYDGYSRSSQQQTKHNSTVVKTDSFTFNNPTTTTTSAQIASHAIASAGFNKNFSYTYDDNGNILTISDGTNTTGYTYDSANQLIRENNQAGNYTYTWTYDNAGNILSKSVYGYTTDSLENVAPTDTISYTYGYNEWRDLLTGYDGNTITSDTIGNMLSDGTWTYTWKHGRQLATMSDGTVTWNYTYNADGLRTKRTDGTNTYTYVYNGSQLTQMSDGTNTLYFTYDASGTPLALIYNNSLYYYYVTNVQGDVIALVDSTGATVVEYTYDAWGNVLTTSGLFANTIGAQNPLRYRGYVYDTETGLYYLQSRYYSPEMGRFINADVYIATGQGFVGNNMFAYCLNNPVMFADPTGQSAAAAGVVAKVIYISAESLLIAAGITILVIIVTSPQARREISDGITIITNTIGSAVDGWIDEQKKSIEDKLTISLTKSVSKKGGTEYHLHHIVAQSSPKAAPARYIIEKLLPSGVNNILNLVYVKRSVHQRLHTNIYFNTINYSIMSAYLSAGIDRKQQIQNITTALLFWQAYINSLNLLAPD